MNRNVPASFGLSLLTVAFFAVALYQRDPPPPSAHAAGSVGPTDARPAAEPLDPWDDGPIAAPLDLTASRPPAPPVARPVVARSATVVARGAQGDGLRQVARTRPTREPRGAFTTSRPGETLAEVARRVYGSRDSARALWLANRDLLDRPDAPLRDGTLLRTP